MNISKPQVQDACRGPTTYHKIKIFGFFIVAGYANNIHIVTHGKGGSLKCDQACVNSSTKICEHQCPGSSASPWKTSSWHGTDPTEGQIQKRA